MTIRTIIVHLDHSERCVARIELAAAIARKHDAHLVGLVPTGLLDGTIPADMIATGTSDFIAESVDFLRVRAEAIAHVFNDHLRHAERVSHEVRMEDGMPADAVARRGRASDLVVVGQVDELDKTGGVGATTLPQQVVLGVGRPVLVVPRVGTFKELGRRVLVAWDGTREAAVALRDALPLMDPSSQVTLLSLRERDPLDQDALQIRQTLAWLQRHGIPAEARQEVCTIDFADALLSRAADASADLLVMGCYGHSRLREFVLGGVTREMLAHMTLPLLMAH